MCSPLPVFPFALDLALYLCCNLPLFRVFIIILMPTIRTFINYAWCGIQRVFYLPKLQSLERNQATVDFGGMLYHIHVGMMRKRHGLSPEVWSG